MGDFVKLDGAEDLIKRLRSLGPEAVEAADGAVADEAERLYAIAQTEVPLASGALSDSGFADHAPPRKSNAAATVGYEIDYAAAVHEGIHGGKHQQEAPPRWLERAFDAWIDGALDAIADRIAAWMDGDGGEGE